MKRLLYALPIVLGLAAGCSKTEDIPPPVQPQGAFSGTFLKLRNPRVVNSKQVWDTTKINLNLTLTGNNFAVTGDTTKHAGSKGPFAYDGAYMQFQDATVPANTKDITKLPKIHLAGIFRYQYDGTRLQVLAQTDTLVHFYDLKK
ncbi:hypothetical protein KHS38_09375 [Mucilaginibacter sp. Bleaf8]|uniref:hypothetical protein n=1 Tax=Mucilaginibacter sp. Bleaf8 TaxID=2834430 RepID=UPI001BCC83A4|nr:hypothetical protein [Mucilaginibacter sp. Bleaf8]MBS7564616.1 hypothetical protein [Mucilaginibacter sp. Bleaf8]